MGRGAVFIGIFSLLPQLLWAQLNQVLQPVQASLPQQAAPAAVDLKDPLTDSVNPNHLSGYIPIGTAYDNPNNDVLTNSATAIPIQSDCTVRPQTVIEIEKVRKSAAQMAGSIGLEAENIGKRKTYIEQMSAYLNDRIRELNKIKQELADELRWVEVTNERIRLLNDQEKQMKLQDIMACMNIDKNRVLGSGNVNNKVLQDLQKTSKNLQLNVEKSMKKITQIENGEKGDGASGGAAPGAAAAA